MTNFAEIPCLENRRLCLRFTDDSCKRLPGGNDSRRRFFSLFFLYGILVAKERINQNKTTKKTKN
jgi:hypothetical protein